MRSVFCGVRARTSRPSPWCTRIARRDELGELAAGFNRLAQILEQNQTLRRRWVADVAHELRTPLAILTGEVDAVAERIRPWDARAKAFL